MCTGALAGSLLAAQTLLWKGGRCGKRVLPEVIHLVQHPGLLVTFTFFPSESAVEADPDLLRVSGPSMVDIGWRRWVCFLEQIYHLTRGPVVQGNKHKLQVFWLYCKQYVSLWKGTWILNQVMPGDGSCEVTAGCKCSAEYSVLAYWLLMWLLLAQSCALWRFEQVVVESTLVLMSQSHWWGIHRLLTRFCCSWYEVL